MVPTEQFQNILWPQGWEKPHLSRILAVDVHQCERASADAECHLGRYLMKLQHGAQHNEFLDQGLGRLLVDAMRVVLADTRHQTLPDRQWTQMALVYLISTDDAVNDLTALDGLDDDAEIVLGLLAAIRRPDLAEPIRRHLHR